LSQTISKFYFKAKFSLFTIMWIFGYIDALSNYSRKDLVILGFF